MNINYHHQHNQPGLNIPANAVIDKLKGPGANIAVPRDSGDGFFSVRRGTQTVETGYELHPAYWGQGLMIEALRAALACCFSAQSPIPVHRVEAIVMPANRVSIRVLEKFGL